VVETKAVKQMDQQALKWDRGCTCVLATLIVGVVLFLPPFGRNSLAEDGPLPLANDGRRGLRVVNIDDMLKLQEREVDIAVGALLIAKEVDPAINVSRYLVRLDSMARELKQQLNASSKRDDVIETLRRYVFSQQGFTYSVEGPDLSLLSTVMDNKKGNCIGLATVYLGLAERVGIPLHPAYVWRHVFLRCVISDKLRDIELARNGEGVPDGEYLKRHCRPGQEHSGGVGPVELDKHQFLALILCNAAALYADQGNLARSEWACRKAAGIFPGFVDAWLKLGMIHLEKKEFAQGRKALRQALSLDSKNAEIWFCLGMIDDAVQKWEAAASAYRNAIERDPNYIRAWRALVSLYAKQGKLKDAVDVCVEATGKNSKSETLWVTLASLHVRSARHEKAVRAWQKALGLNSKNAGSWANIGISLAEMGRFAEAADACKKALAIDSKLVSPWITLSWAKGKVGDIDEAIAAAKQALSLDPTAAMAWNNLGWLQGLKGDDEKCVETCSKALALKPDLEKALGNLTIAYIHQEDWGKATEAVEKTLALDPDNPYLWYQLACISARDGRIGKSLGAFMMNARLNPKPYIRTSVVFVVLPVLCLLFFLRARQRLRKRRWIGGILLVLLLMVFLAGIRNAANILGYSRLRLWVHPVAALYCLPSTIAVIAGIRFVIKKDQVPEGQTESSS